MHNLDELLEGISDYAENIIIWRMVYTTHLSIISYRPSVTGTLMGLVDLQVFSVLRLTKVMKLLSIF